MIRPSSLPMLAACPCWQPEETGNDAAAGNVRHAFLSARLQGEEALIPPDDQLAGLEWAEEYIKCHAPTSEHPLVSEQKLALLDDDFNVLMTGTPDVTCGRYLFDLKWRERAYGEQMAAYALMMMQQSDWPEVEAHVLYACNKRAVVITFTRESALEIVSTVIASAKAPEKQPQPCSYCSWCSARKTCPALINQVAAVHAGRPDWGLSTFHATELSNPVEMGKALKMARCLKGWCEAIEHHAKEMALKLGTVPTGYKIQSRRGKRTIESVEAAFGRCGLPQAEFLAACKVDFSSLVETAAIFHGMPKKAAERTMEEKLGELCVRRSSTVSLVEEK